MSVINLASHASYCYHQQQQQQQQHQQRHISKSKVQLAKRRRFGVSASVRRLWTPTPVLKVSPAAESLFHISVDVSDWPDLAQSYTNPGQYLQLQLQDNKSKPSFLAIASPPNLALSKGVFEFLVKSSSVPGSTSHILCQLHKGDVVQLGPVLGNGFHIQRIQDCQTLLLFATGSGISPIRSLIEAGFSADKRSDVRLYYGARNIDMMAYQERFKDWESSGVSIVPVLSQPDDSWRGEHGYVQAAFTKHKRISSPQSTGALLSGQKQMAEEVTSVLVADGVSSEKILMNF